MSSRGAWTRAILPKFYSRNSTVVSLLIALTLLPSTAAAQPRHRIATLLVMPFENRSRVAGAEWLSEACSEVLVQRMASAGLYVVSRNQRVYSFDHAGVPVDVKPSRATIFRVAEQMGADFVVLGSYDVSAEAFQVSAQLLEVKNPKLRPEIKRSGSLADFLSLQTSLAWTLLQEMPNAPQVNEQQFIASAAPIRLEAFENYVRGVVSSSRPQKVRYFKEALRLDPGYGAAALQLGKTYYDGHEYEQAILWLTKVPKDDAAAGEATFLIGMAEYNSGYLDRAAAAFSSLADRVPLTEVYNNIGVVDARRGRRLQAVEYFTKAVEADPSDADYHFNLALALFKSGDSGGAGRQLRDALRLRPADAEAKALSDMVNRGVAAPPVAGISAPAQPRIPIERIKRNYDEASYRQIQLQINNLKQQQRTK
jgi:tetratricopeptide (TPR) repeat protein